MSSSAFNEEVGSDPRDGDLQSMLGDNGEGDVDAMLDTSYSPPDRQPRQSFEHEDFDQRLAEEEPEIWAGDDQAEDSLDSADGDDGELRDDQVGGRRAGRLSDGGYGDDVFASDCGVDGGAASAEEAAMHVIDDSDY